MILDPMEDRVIVTPLVAEGEKKFGSLILPDISEQKPTMGEVIAVGPGKPVDGGKVRPVDLAVGDTVIYGKFSGVEIEVDGRKVLFLRASDIMARVREGDAP